MAALTCCRLWIDAPRDAAANMAVDEALLLDVAETRSPVLRFYAWSAPALTIGYFQPYGTASAEDCTVVRRPTGGGVVDHRHDVTFSVVVPRSHRLFEVDRFTSYRLLNQAVADGIGRLGIACRLTDAASEVEDRRHLVCFDSPARFDVVTAAGKVCGGAQRRSRHGMLVQASMDRNRLPGHSRRAIVDAVREPLQEVLGEDAQEVVPPPELLAAAARLREVKYATAAWNQKR